ncbi:type 1 glutamine amidotransferase [Roseomonas sp. BN140053]|uniref:type 1 glutamine amidotransferase n=1 Tax=Roseomonas sp. BN140053 TaxID=3391898 RepID=UPI0039ED1062
MGLRVTVIENAPGAPVGSFGDYLVAEHGAALRVIPGPGLPDPAALAEADLHVVLGSPHSAYDELPWIAAERRLLAELIAADRPVIGICFGAQMIAAAIGGTVQPTGTFHGGWTEVASLGDPVWQGPWVRWHGDHFQLPPAAEVLATADGTIQAFGYRRAVGVQFHPEATEAILRGWAGRADPRRALGPEGTAAMLEAAAAGLQGAAARRKALFDAMLRRCLAPVPAG